MAEFQLTVDLDNAAFEDDPLYELRRIFKRFVVGDMLRDLDIDNPRTWKHGGSILDINGNTVGQWRFTDGAQAQDPQTS